jgi:hypothetical protein
MDRLGDAGRQDEVAVSSVPEDDRVGLPPTIPEDDEVGGLEHLNRPRASRFYVVE